MALRSQQVWLSSSTALQHSRRFPMLSLLHRRFVASYAGKQVAKGVPVIDVSELCHTPDKDLSAEMKVCRDIRDACSEWGFFQAINAPISNSLLFRYYAQKQAFFALPIKAKERVRRTASNSKGWYDDELTKQKRDWKEGFDVGAQNGSLDVSGLDGENQWPMEGGKGEGEGGFCGFENTVREYYDANERFARSLTCAMAVGLGLQPEALVKDSFDACHTSYLRMNYYPPCPEPDAHMAISHHTDAGAVTVLSQSAVQSLQVQSREDGSWWDVKPIPGAFVINTGDVMQVWSNDIYKAPVHRVKAQLGLLRYSSPFFYNPSYATNYAPLSACVTPDRPAAYRPINWGEFRLARFAGDFADVGEDVQISHYRADT